MNKFISLLLLCLFLAACSSGDLSIGFDITPQDDSKYVLVDSFSVKTETFKSGQHTNAGASELLAGRKIYDANHEFSASAYFTVSQPISSYNALTAGSDLLIDSVTLILPVNSYEGDSLSYQKFSLYQLEEELSLTREYKTDEQLAVSRLLSEDVIRPKNKADTALHFNLSGEFYLPLLQEYRNYSENLANRLSLLVKGLRVEATSSVGSLLHLNSSGSVLRVYGHLNSSMSVTTVDFPVEVSKRLFNSFSYFKNGEPLTLTNGIAGSANGITILQDGLPILTKVTFPGISRFEEHYQGNRILKAELVFYSVRKAANAFPSPPGTLNLYTLNKQNELLNPVSVSGGGTVTAVHQNDFSEIIYRGYYAFDVTSYMQSLVTYELKNDGVTFITESGISNFNSTAGVLLGNENSGEYKCKLKLYLSK